MQEIIMRFIRRYMFSLETLVISALSIIVYAYIFHGIKIWSLVARALLRPFQRKTLTNFNDPHVDRSNATKSIFADYKEKVTWDLRKENVSVYSIQGRRPHMEDRFNHVSNLDNTGTSIYGVFDGHGGEFAADFVNNLLFRALKLRLSNKNGASSGSDFSAILTEEILKVDKQLLSLEHATKDASGTTAIIAIHGGHKLTVANVGDSRAVLCDKDGKAIPLSYDHKPQQLKERQRIKEAGGFISFNGVWRVAGVLATSRALGDYSLKEDNLVIANPDTLTFDLRDHQSLFMIIATDGLWDTFSNEEAVSYIKVHLDEPYFGAKSITIEAYKRGSLDNITVMVVKFKNSSL